MDENESTTRSETVRLRHPHTGDVREVEATPEKLVPCYSESRIIPNSALGFWPAGAGT